MKKKNHVKLSASDRSELTSMLSKGSLRAKVYKRCQSLLLLDEGRTIQFVSDSVGISRVSLHKWIGHYKSEGLTFLKDKPRSGRPPGLSGEVRAKVTALACSTPPEGRSRWSLRLLADKAVELEFCEELSHTEVGRILKKTNFNLIESANGVSEL